MGIMPTTQDDKSKGKKFYLKSVIIGVWFYFLVIEV
jgi:hypothetical protein